MLGGAGPLLTLQQWAAASPSLSPASPLATSLMVMTMGTSEAVGKLWPPAVTRDKLTNPEQMDLPKAKDPRNLVVWILAQTCAKLKTILFDNNFDTKCKKFVASYPVVTSGTCISVSGNEKGRGGWRLEAGWGALLCPRRGRSLEILN